MVTLMVKNVWVVGAAAIICFSCRSRVPTQPVSLMPAQRWAAQNIHNYTVDQKAACFCVSSGELVRITVRNDTIASAVRISDSTVMLASFYRSIDSLFAIVKNPHGDSLVVRYNSQYGYPEYLDINPQLHPVDGGILYETSNLRAQ